MALFKKFVATPARQQAEQSTQVDTAKVDFIANIKKLETELQVDFIATIKKLETELQETKIELLKAQADAELWHENYNSLWNDIQNELHREQQRKNNLLQPDIDIGNRKPDGNPAKVLQAIKALGGSARVSEIYEYCLDTGQAVKKELIKSACYALASNETIHNHFGVFSIPSSQRTADEKETRLIEAVRLFIENHGDSRFVKFSEKNDSRVVINRAGYFDDSDGVFLILPETFKQEILKGHSFTLAKKALSERGILLSGEHGKNTRKIRIGNITQNVYPICAEALNNYNGGEINQKGLKS